jgi:hypothetical protein
MESWRRITSSDRRRTSRFAVVLALTAGLSLGILHWGVAQTPPGPPAGVPVPVDAQLLMVRPPRATVNVGEEAPITAQLWVPPLNGRLPQSTDQPLPGYIRLYAVETGAPGSANAGRPLPGRSYALIQACPTRVCTKGYTLDHPGYVVFSASATARAQASNPSRVTSHRWVIRGQAGRVVVRWRTPPTWTGRWNAYDGARPKGTVTWQDNGATVTGHYDWLAGTSGDYTATKRPESPQIIDGRWTPTRGTPGEPGSFRATLQGTEFTFEEVDASGAANGTSWMGYCDERPTPPQPCAANG